MIAPHRKSSSTSLAVIIARAGSKGLPHKHMRMLGGKPILAWTIEHALGSHRVDHVVLTTDGQDMLDVGRSYGIHVYERPASRAGDNATVDDGARHGVESWEAQFGGECDYVAILYGSIPLRPANLTDRALTMLIETEADSVQSVYPVGKMHPFWMRKLTGSFGNVLEQYQPNEVFRRQDLPPVYMLNGGVIAVTRKSLFNVDPKHPHAFLGTDRRAFATAPTDVVDVDDELDLIMAEAIVRKRAAAAS